jgi:hypothetical protein
MKKFSSSGSGMDRTNSAMIAFEWLRPERNQKAGPREFASHVHLCVSGPITGRYRNLILLPRASEATSGFVPLSLALQGKRGKYEQQHARYRHHHPQHMLPASRPRPFDISHSASSPIPRWGG